MNRDAALGVGAGVAVMVLFAGMLVVSRFGATSSLTVYDMAGLRFGVAGVCTLPVILSIRWPRLALWKMLVIAATSGSPFALFLFAGMSYAPVAHGGIVINGAMPVLAALVAWLAFGDRLGAWRIVGIVLIAHAARMLGGMRQAAIMSGAPAVAVLVAIPALGEVPSVISIAGVAVVTAGILVAIGPGLLAGAASPKKSEPAT